MSIRIICDFCQKTDEDVSPIVYQRKYGKDVGICIECVNFLAKKLKEVERDKSK